MAALVHFHVVAIPAAQVIPDPYCMQARVVLPINPPLAHDFARHGVDGNRQRSQLGRMGQALRRYVGAAIGVAWRRQAIAGQARASRQGDHCGQGKGANHARSPPLVNSYSLATMVSSTHSLLSWYVRDILLPFPFRRLVGDITWYVP